MKFSYGEAQVLTSDRMKKHPIIAKLVHRIFGYTNVGNYARSLVFIKLIKQLPLQSFTRVLDIGCGYGEFTFMLAESLETVTVTALDVNEERLAAVQRVKEALDIKNVIVHSGKVESLPSGETFDFIYSIDVFEHIDEQEMPFAECFNRLREGGYLFVKMPNVTQKTILPDALFEEHQEWLDDEHIGQVYDLEDLKHRFIQTGFNIVQASYSDGFLSRVAWEIGYFAKKGGSIIQLLFLPLVKLLIHINQLLNNSTSGNAIQVLGKKPAK